MDGPPAPKRTALWRPDGLGALRRAPISRLYSPPSGGVRRSASLAPADSSGSYLVDSASSHMLVSKIKPCMSKYKQLYSETANGSLNQLSFI